jgi:hypothetical protein
MPLQDRDWYRAEHRERQAKRPRQVRRKLWPVWATIGVLFATVFALAAPLLSSVATNMRCNRGGFSVIIFLIGGDCPGGTAMLRLRP